MGLAKTGEIQKMCEPNALMTLMEYALDYGNEGKETKYESICSNLTNVKKKIGKSFAEHLESSPKAHEAFKKYLTQK